MAKWPISEYVDSKKVGGGVNHPPNTPLATALSVSLQLYLQHIYAWFNLTNKYMS